VNRAQKAVLWVSAVLLILMLLVPPWRDPSAWPSGGFWRIIGYAFLFSPAESFGLSVVDVARLWVQALIVLAAAATLTILLGHPPEAASAETPRPSRFAGGPTLLSRRQKAFLCVGLFIIIVLFLFPPWLTFADWGSSSMPESRHYAFLLLPPPAPGLASDQDTYYYNVVETDMVWIQSCLVAIATVLVVISLMEQEAKLRLAALAVRIRNWTSTNRKQKVVISVAVVVLVAILLFPSFLAVWEKGASIAGPTGHAFLFSQHEYQALGEFYTLDTVRLRVELLIVLIAAGTLFTLLADVRTRPLPTSSSTYTKLRLLGSKAMNRRQKVVLCAGAVILIVALLFPPWFLARPDYDAAARMGYGFLFMPPRDAYVLDHSRLWAEAVAVVLITGLLVYLLGGKKTQREPEP